jgi:hypothetical protein
MSDKIQEENMKAVKEYFAEQRSIDDLTEEQIELACEEQERLQNEPEETPEKQEEEVEEGVEGVKVEEKTFDHHKKLADALAEANRYKQLNEDKERKLRDLKENEDFRNKYLGIETHPKVDRDRDYLDDEHQAKLEAKVEALEKREAEREERARKKSEELEIKEKQLQLFSEISNLQSAYKQLQTSESFQSIDKKFVEWQDVAEQNGVDVNQYLSDADYRKKKDTEGFKLNVSEKDLNKTLEIYNIYEQYNSEVKAGYKSSMERVFEGSSTYKELMKKKLTSHRQADDDALDRLIEERSKEVSLLDTGGAPADADDLGTLLDEQDALSRKTNMTPADKKRFHELDKQINLMTQ